MQKVAYLEFQLTEEGIKPGSDKLKVVATAKPPVNVHKIRQFLGLCNFFCTHVRNFSQVSAPLTALTTKRTAHGNQDLYQRTPTKPFVSYNPVSVRNQLWINLNKTGSMHSSPMPH